MPNIDPREPVVGEKVATRFGELQVVPNDRPISEALRLYGEWAQAEIEILIRLLPASGVIVDGGSHIGIHTRAFALASPGSIVHAFEPHPQLVPVLRSNVADLSGRVVVHECALGVSSTVGFMIPIDYTKAGNAGAQAVAFSSSEGSVSVPVTSLDALQLADVAFIKLDVEGAEVAALNGAQETIRRCTPAIVCEVNTLDAAVDVLLLMRRFAYSPLFLTTRAFNPANFSREVKNIFGFATETAMIFLPPGREAPKSTELATVQPAGSVHDLAQAFLAAPRYGDEGLANGFFLKKSVPKRMPAARSLGARLYDGAFRNRIWPTLTKGRGAIRALFLACGRDRYCPPVAGAGAAGGVV